MPKIAQFSRISSIILMLCSSNLLSASQVSFNKACEDEILKLQEQLIYFFSEELLEAGLFQDAASALHAAQDDITREAKDNPPSYFYLVSDEHENARLGYIAYSIDKETAFIEGLFLDPKYRGLGLGKATLYNLEKELEKRGIIFIELYVFAHNQTASNLYKKLGFEIETPYFNNEVLIGCLMRKKI